jgi:hypothetical protein
MKEIEELLETATTDLSDEDKANLQLKLLSSSIPLS